MRKLRAGWNKWAALFALFALLLQTFVPLGQALAAEVTGDGSLQARMIICTQFGVKIINTETGQEVPAEEGGSGDCPVCMAAAIGKLSLDNAEPCSLVPPSETIKTRMAASHAALDGLPASSAHRPRAPPVVL